jgi:hypothetical protein
MKALHKKKRLKRPDVVTVKIINYQPSYMARAVSAGLLILRRFDVPLIVPAKIHRRTAL